MQDSSNGQSGFGWKMPHTFTTYYQDTPTLQTAHPVNENYAPLPAPMYNSPAPPPPGIGFQLPGPQQQPQATYPSATSPSSYGVGQPQTGLPYPGKDDISYQPGYGPPQSNYNNNNNNNIGWNSSFDTAGQSQPVRVQETMIEPQRIEEEMARPQRRYNIFSESTVMLPEIVEKSNWHGASNSYENVKRTCQSHGRLWEDPDFPANDRSIGKARRRIEWKRPHEICQRPKFIDQDGLNRSDVVQGELGDCWLLAAVANLTMHPELIARVVPNSPPQTFDRPNYFGAFRFQFWVYGNWMEVIVDDRLPTYHGQLVYMHSAARNEFWSALLEKAYAKLVGSYSNLAGGLASESMTDFTGGFCETFDLTRNAPPGLFTIIEKANERCSLMSCSINPRSNMRMEDRLVNGLVVGHAYSVTDVKQVNSRGRPVNLVRIRNPWGKAEWNGAFSDRSHEWREIPENEKSRLGLVFDNDGEFWMSFDDFMRCFDLLEICHLSLDLVGLDRDHRSHAMLRRQKSLTQSKGWETTIITGEWRRRHNAGGCSNYNKTFHTNPQLRIRVTEVDDYDRDKLSTVLVGLMQKDRRKRKSSDSNAFLTIGFSIYKMPDRDGDNPLDENFFSVNVSKARSIFINMREVSGRFKFRPGVYCIVPSTFEPETEGEFVLRVYSEKKCDTNQIGGIFSTQAIFRQPNQYGDEREKSFSPFLKFSI